MVVLVKVVAVLLLMRSDTRMASTPPEKCMSSWDGGGGVS